MDFTKIIRHLERKKQMHRLISNETTGTPETFAKKFSLSRRKMYYELEFFKNCNAPIKYSKVNQTFYYDGEFEINFDFYFTITLERKTQKIFHISTKDERNVLTQNGFVSVP
jgi:transcriptional antiterminator